MSMLPTFLEYVLVCMAHIAFVQSALIQCHGWAPGDRGLIIYEAQAPSTSKGFSRDTIQEERRDSGFASVRTFAGRSAAGAATVPAITRRFRRAPADSSSSEPPDPGTGQNSHLDSHLSTTYLSERGLGDLESGHAFSKCAESA